MSLNIIKNIIQDLSKIEYALRVENVDSQVSHALGIVIIELYRHLILYGEDYNNIGTDKLFDVYSIMSQYQHSQDPQYQNLMNEVIDNIQKIIQQAIKAPS